MKNLKQVLIVLAACAAFAGSASPKPETVLLLNESYFEAAHREIESAKESIHLIMYRYLYYKRKSLSYPNRLFADLEAAHKRGVPVRVILDAPKLKYMPKAGPENREVYQRLKDAGIDVKYDSTGTTTHAKVLVVDGRTVILGSHNYTDSGMKYNNEASLLLRDPKIAGELISYFGEIR